MDLVERNLGDAFSKAFAKQNDEDEIGGIVTKWIALADVMTPKGERLLRFITDDSLMSWEIVGMLKSAQTEVDPPYVFAAVEGD